MYRGSSVFDWLLVYGGPVSHCVKMEVSKGK